MPRCAPAASIATVGNLLLLALAAAIYPTLLAGVILILALPNPRRRLAGFFAGGMATSLTAGFVILFALEDTGAVKKSDRTFGPALSVAVAALSLTIAARLWRRRDAVPRPAARKPSLLDRSLRGGSLLPAILAGVVLNLPGAWYLAALKDIGDAQYGTGTDVLLVVAFNLVMFTLVEVPLVWYTVSPDGAEAAVGRLDAWLRANSARVGAVVAGTIGIYLLARGVAQALG
jgi:Sap, sulfolipid-1-addressing protein